MVITGTTLDAYFEVVPDVRAKKEASVELARERTWTLLNSTWCYVGSRVSVTAQNLGRETLDAQNSTIVVDGVAYTGFGFTVDNRTGTSVWTPGLNATYNQTGFSSAPTDVMLVTRAGVQTFPYRTVCTIPVHIHLMETYKAGVAASTFERGTDTIEVRVTIVDDNGAVFAGAAIDLDWVKPNTNIDHSSSATTDGAGIASFTWAIPNGANTGSWNARVTSVTGSGVFYNSAANVQTQVGFSVTN